MNSLTILLYIMIMNTNNTKFCCFCFWCFLAVSSVRAWEEQVCSLLSITSFSTSEITTLWTFTGLWLSCAVRGCAWCRIWWVHRRAKLNTNILDSDSTVDLKPKTKSLFYPRVWVTNTTYVQSLSDHIKVCLCQTWIIESTNKFREFWFEILK